MVLNNSQYDAIMRDYNRKQLNAKYDLDQRMAEVLVAIPEYRKLSDEIAALSVKSAISALNGSYSDHETLCMNISSIEVKLKKLLHEAGYPDDYLELHYECNLCKDTGYINNAKCSCLKQAEIDMLYNQSNLNDILSSENFDTFSYDYYSKSYKDSSTGLTPLDNIKKVVSICKDFAANFSNTGNNGNILFYGDTGVGKTFLSNSIAKELLDKAFSVIYVSAIDLFDYFSKTNDNFDNTGLDNSSPEMQIINCDLLIIDDLGTELSNSFTNSKLFYCINNRLLQDKSTIISTNCSLEDLMRNYSERIFSRISSSYKLLKLFGDDIRLIKK